MSLHSKVRYDSPQRTTVDLTALGDNDWRTWALSQTPWLQWIQSSTLDMSDGSPDHENRGGWQPRIHWNRVNPVDEWAFYLPIGLGVIARAETHIDAKVAAERPPDMRGCELEEKEGFWSELDEVMESIPTGERVVIGADFNGHVGEGNTGDEEVMGKFGVKERNLEGQMVVDFAKRMDMAVVNTYFQKREEHRVTYKSGDLEKEYDRVPREELWYRMRKSGVAEKYVRVVQDMYERSRTVVRCAVGQTEEFKVEVGLHQGLALSPFLFAIVMDQLSEEVRQESPWTMMFADDIVICSESREQVEESLERWRFALERRRGMKVSRSKTEYMCVNEREGSGTVRLQGEEMKKVQEFKYLGSTVQSNGECGNEVKKRVQAGWNGWRKVSGVLCDRKISARIKGKVYRTVVRPAMLYGLETVSLRKRRESELEVAELKMLMFSLGVTRLDRIRNEYIRGTAHVGHLGDKVREARLRWFGHVQRRETEGSLIPIFLFSGSNKNSS
ncbi:hypothetical protein QTP86_008756 [Hemibagrus guttatus]|nr:hypothetical protein QTP86_008756 [Hemibagrus guttatus]